MTEPIQQTGRSRITIYDIAQRAGVSPATVSRYLNSSARIRPQLREGIAAAIAELDYQPSPVARALAGQRTGIVALGVPDIANPRWAEVARGLEATLATAGLSLVLVLISPDTEHQREIELAMLDRVYRMRAEALVVSMRTYKPGDFNRLMQAGTHVVSISNDIVDPTVDSVVPDRITAVHQGIDHLAELGHRRIAFIDGPGSLTGVHARTEAFRDACLQTEIEWEPDLVITLPEPALGNDGSFAHDVLRLGATAALVTNDQWAIDLWMGLERIGCTVPGDVSIVGMDDIPMAAVVRTGLTTLAMDRIERGRLAAGIVQQRLAQTTDTEAQKLLIPPHLVVRSSTALPAESGRFTGSQRSEIRTEARAWTATLPEGMGTTS